MLWLSMWLIRKKRLIICACLTCSLVVIYSSLFSMIRLIELTQHVLPRTIKSFYPQDNSGCRANYSCPEVEVFVKTYKSRYNRPNNVFVISFEESYDIFLKRLTSLKKKGQMLIRDAYQWRNTSAERFRRGICQHYLYDPADLRLIEDLIIDLRTLPISSTEVPMGGSQVKIKLTFADGSKGYFKPMRVPRETETSMDTFYFHEIERHTAEIAGYHLDRMLGFNRAVPVVGRVLNIATDLATFISNTSYVERVYTSPAGNLCFAARCLQFCGTVNSICGRGPLLEGSISAALVMGRSLIVHPYKRSYSFVEKAVWEIDNTFCDTQLKNKISLYHLLELIDLAAFDFFIGNMDRHEYELFKDIEDDSLIPVYDNGRGFGMSKHDCMSCLAPLQQCCQIRLSTLAKLIKLYQGPDSLSQVMRKSLTSDPLSHILTEPHLDALDRRLGKVIKAVSDCISDGRSWDNVVIDDVFGQ